MQLLLCGQYLSEHCFLESQDCCCNVKIEVLKHIKVFNNVYNIKLHWCRMIWNLQLPKNTGGATDILEHKNIQIISQYCR